MKKLGGYLFLASVGVAMAVVYVWVCIRDVYRFLFPKTKDFKIINRDACPICPHSDG